IPVEKKAGDRVFAGTPNQRGSLRFRAEKVGGDTLLATIVRRVEEAQGSKAPVQRLVDRVAAVFVPVVLGIAVLTFLTWWLFGGTEALSQGLLAAVTVLVIACPCALGLATPTALMVGVGRGAEAGILIKDAESLETAHRVDTVVLDKTGTLTEGHPAVTALEWQPGVDAAQLAPVLLALEQASEHPLAEAIARHLREQGVKPVRLTGFESLTGLGVRGSFDGKTYFVGKDNYPRQGLKSSQGLEHDGEILVGFSNETDLLARIALADPLKSTSAEAVKRLRNAGIEVHLLTGDQAPTARRVAELGGIDHVKAGVLPQEKADFVKALQAEGKTVAMVGDGINDAQALSLANLSVAMGHGSDVAMDVAKMTLLSSDLLALPRALRLSRRTVATIRQNLFWAFVYNVVGIPLAAGVLYPINGFLLNPMLAGAAMALSSVSVVLNSLRLRRGTL
ncbi:MAG: heavy metal translocating P-type ATPase, partial [Sphingobacteriaceae bacterium]|nr:heavy metal translocating P-type ATPase [Cytophagaceae bacterium]